MSYSVTFIFGASLEIAVFTNLLNTTSMATLSSVLAQSQLLFLLLFTRACIPYYIMTIITSSKFSLNFPSYIHFRSLGFCIYAIGYFNFALNNNTLCFLSIESFSSIYNIFQALLMIITDDSSSHIHYFTLQIDNKS